MSFQYRIAADASTSTIDVITPRRDLAVDLEGDAIITLDYREALDVVADVLDHLPRHLVDDLIADLAR